MSSIILKMLLLGGLDQEGSGLYQKHYHLLDDLLRFFIVSFDFNVKPGSLPTHNIYETQAGSNNK